MALNLEYSTLAHCQAEHVWQSFQDLEHWPSWNRVIRRTEWVQGAPWEAGSQFVCEITGPANLSVTPTIALCEPARRVAWTAKSFGVGGEQWFSFEPQPDGATLIRSWASVSGALTMFVGENTKRQILAGFADWLDALKQDAERLASQPPPP
jgi:hypothetical protein